MLFCIKIHYTYLKAPMDIIFGMYTQNSVENDNIYLNFNSKLGIGPTIRIAIVSKCYMWVYTHIIS